MQSVSLGTHHSIPIWCIQKVRQWTRAQSEHVAVFELLFIFWIHTIWATWNCWTVYTCVPSETCDRNEINRAAEKLRMVKPLVQTSVDEIFGKTRLLVCSWRLQIHNQRGFNLLWHLIAQQFCNCWMAVLESFLGVMIVSNISVNHRCC